MSTPIPRNAPHTAPKQKANPIPADYPGINAYLGVHDAAAAIEFYKNAFGATEIMRLPMPDGKIGHAEMKIGNSIIMLADEAPDAGHNSPKALGGTTVKLHMYVEDVDAFFERAVAGGAKAIIPPADQFYGDRSGRLEDPFGHLWIVSTHTEDVSPEEMERRMAEFSKGQDQ